MPRSTHDNICIILHFKLSDIHVKNMGKGFGIPKTMGSEVLMLVVQVRENGLKPQYRISVNVSQYLYPKTV